jgi:hypothetical protein
MTVMRNVSRELRDVVDAMDMALQPAIEIVKSVIRGRDVRRMISDATYNLNRPGILRDARFRDMAQSYLNTEYLQADYRICHGRPEPLLRTLPQKVAWFTTYDPRLSVGQFLNQFYNGIVGKHRRRRLP